MASMPGGKWGVGVREEIGGKHYVTQRPESRQPGEKCFPGAEPIILRW